VASRWRPPQSLQILAPDPGNRGAVRQRESARYPLYKRHLNDLVWVFKTMGCQRRTSGHADGERYPGALWRPGMSCHRAQSPHGPRQEGARPQPRLPTAGVRAERLDVFPQFRGRIGGDRAETARSATCRTEILYCDHAFTAQPAIRPPFGIRPLMHQRHAIPFNDLRRSLSCGRTAPS
jgi:hypothetical protein